MSVADAGKETHWDMEEDLYQEEVLEDYHVLRQLVLQGQRPGRSITAPHQAIPDISPLCML